MSVPPESAGGPAAIRRADQQPGVGGDQAIKRSKPDPGRFSLLLIDNATGKATRVNVYPLRLDTTLKSSARGRQLAVGWLMMQLAAAAQKLWPEFDPEREPVKLTGFPVLEQTVEGPHVPFVPVWRRRGRWNVDDDESGG